jgi:sigma54-dependent transcription regulator
MLLSKNPYSPGAGRIPAALVGRDIQLETWDAQMERISRGVDARPMALYGLRGIGKTVLLSKMHEMAPARKWISARIEADVASNLREAISHEFDSQLADLISPTD